MPSSLHTCKSGECYVDSLAVLPSSRGLGVGTKLLQWGETIARSRASTKMTLAVLNGNPAMRLYKRYGFEVDEADCCDVCVGACIVTCLMGRPYGVCHKEWGASDMTKPLVRAAQVIER